MWLKTNKHFNQCSEGFLILRKYPAAARYW
jgi:hypothetical protein